MKWPVIGTIVVVLALLGGGMHTRTVYRPMTSAEAAAANRYAAQLAAYRADVKRWCAPVLRREQRP